MNWNKPKYKAAPIWAPAESHFDCGESLPLPPLTILCSSWDSTTLAVAVCSKESYLVVLKNTSSQKITEAH